MQSYCIYAEAFAGPFRPLRAPEPPFTHKTPPFTQVLFLFDAFYGTISLRKPSSLCSYKTESEAPYEKTHSRPASCLQHDTFPFAGICPRRYGGGIGSAVYASNEPLPDLVMDNDTGRPDLSGITPVSEGVYQGNGWKYEIGIVSDTLTLETGIYDFNNTKPTTKDGKVLKLVQCKVVVKNGATITGGWFHQMLNYGTVENSLLSNNDIENCDGGTMTNCLFKCSKPPVGVANYHKLTEVTNSEFEVTLLNAPSGFMGWTTYYFTGTPKLVVRLSKYGGGFNELQCINGRTDYGDKTGPDSDGYYTFTPNAGEDVVLNLNYYITDLVITKDGFPDTTGREPIYGTGCRGNGWTYENGTLTLERGKYDFSKDGLGQLAPDVKLVVGPSVTLTGGVFNEKPDGLTTDNVQTIILNGSGSIEAVNGLSSQKWSKKLYAIKDSQVEIKASVPLADINCRVIDPHYYPDSRDKTTLLFTINGDFIYSYTKLGETELTLNKSTRTNLIMLDNGCPNLEGVPYNWDSMYTYTGDGWKYVFNNSGSLRLNDTSSYNFRYLDPLSKNGNKLAAVTCGIINSGATIEDGVFKNLVINHSGIISGGTFAVGLFSIDSEDFSTSGTVTGGAFNGKDGLSDGAHAVTVNGGSIRKVNDTEPLEAHEINDSYGLRYDIVQSTEWNLYSYEGTIVTVTADTEITNINGWDIGKFTASS